MSVQVWGCGVGGQVAAGRVCVCVCPPSRFHLKRLITDT